MPEDIVNSIRSSWEKYSSQISSHLNKSFGIGLLVGILLTSTVFSSYIYWNSIDHRTTVPVTVVTCDSCEYDRFKDATDRMFKTEYTEVDYKSERGQQLVQEYNLNYVPGFIFDRGQLEKAENFTAVEPTLVKMEEGYVMPDAGVEVAQRLSEGKALNRSE